MTRGKVTETSTKGMTREDWINSRMSSIGGSDAAAIVGLSKWSTPYTVWADKTGRTPPVEDNEAMRQGRDLEQYVAERWMEATGKKCRRRTGIFKNDKYPFAHANIDRFVVGENAGLECKTTSVFNLKAFKGGEYPDNYYAQCVHYMAMTGADRWYLAVLVLNQGFYHYAIERDEAEIDALMTAEKAFWDYVEKDTAPPVDGLKPTGDCQNSLYLAGYQEEDTAIDLFGYDKKIDAYFDIKNRISDLEQEKTLIEQEIKEELKESEEGFSDRYKVSWKGQSRKSFNVKDFQAAYPELDLEPFYKTSHFRRFSIKEAK